MPIEQRKRNRVPGRGVTCIVGMQMISAVVARKQSGRVVGITHNLIEIDHSIEFTIGSYSVVDLLTHDFLLRSVKAVVGIF